MTYSSTSKKPTKEKRALYLFMERHKNRGTVSGRALAKYIKKKKYSAHGVKLGKKSAFRIVNSRGTSLGAGTINKKNRVNWWFVE